MGMNLLGVKIKLTRAQLEMLDYAISELDIKGWEPDIKIKKEIEDILASALSFFSRN